MNDSTPKTPKHLVLHLGAQKTGTTAVQAWCRDNVKTLEGRRVSTRTTQPEIRAALNGRYEVANAEQGSLLKKLLDAAYDDDTSACFYSCESNLGPAFAPGNPALYPRLSRNLHQIEVATRSYQRLVLFTIRDYAEMIESAYVHRIKQGNAVLFREFLSTIDPQISWLPIVKSLIEAFGSENLVIYDHGENRSTQLPLMDRLLKDAMAFLGLNDLAPDESWQRRSNMRYSQRMVNISLALLPNLKTSEEKRAAKSFVEKTFANSGDPPARFLSQFEAQPLRERYTKDLTAIREQAELR